MQTLIAQGHKAYDDETNLHCICNSDVNPAEEKWRAVERDQ